MSITHGDALTYAAWFACLGEPTRVRLLHTVATAPGGLTVGELKDRVGISQSTCSHHVRMLSDIGFLRVSRQGTTTRVTIDDACSVALPHAADVVMGVLAPRPRYPVDPRAEVSVRALDSRDWPAVRDIYGQGLATGLASFDTAVPSRSTLDARWLDGHRWVAELAGEVVGWTALSPVSARSCFSGVADSAVFVAESFRGRGVGKALLRAQVTEADRAGLWLLQTSVLTENRPGIGLHHASGYRTVGVRERIAQRDGVWHDTVLLERRAS
ncbi:helix-turn-helix domain-containing GNAT family N-acetyltransferase [Prauserella cavernicola]|nr:metalloregulator ArsR/SmtB family transcription factor [Prauserella cavernicola]